MKTTLDQAKEKQDLFTKIMQGEINSKNFKKFRLSKSSFYKAYSRVFFFIEVTDPIRYMILNLSQREFQAVRNKQLKMEIQSKPSKRSFPHAVEKQGNEVD